jgi:hypothetical protein
LATDWSAGVRIKEEAGFIFVIFKVLTAANMKMAVFRVVAPCSLVEFNRRFRGACYLHHQGDRPDDGGSKLLDYTAQQPRRQPSSRILLFATTFILFLGAHSAFYLMGTSRKRPELGAGHSLPLSVDVKNVWIFTFIPLYVFIS